MAVFFVDFKFPDQKSKKTAMNIYCNESANQNAPISFFAQLLKYLPRDWILQEDKRISPKCNARKFSLWDQLVSLLFCHLAGCDSLREIEDGLISAVGKLQHLSAKAMGRTTLAYANEHRGYESAQKLYFRLLQTYRNLFNGHLDQDYLRPVYALDSTTISVCLTRFEWAHYRRAKGGFKLHTVLDEDIQLPVVMNMTHGKRADVKEAKAVIEALGNKDITVVMDRGYNDYALFMWLTRRGTKFVTRIKENAKTTRLKDDVIEETQTYGDYGFRFTQEQAQKVCGDTRFRLVQWYDSDNDRWFEFLSNDFDLTAQQIADLYRKRWEIELFFKKLKQNLKIKSFIGTSKNAVMNQIWTAAVATLLIEILRRIARYHWSFSRLLKFVGLNLLTYKKLNVWVNRPDFRVQKQSPPKNLRQMELDLD